jgi:ribonuclease HI
LKGSKTASPLHHLLHTFNLKPSEYETITPASQTPNSPPNFTTEIADTREESKAADSNDDPDAKVYADGSGIEGNAGAAAVLYKKGRHSKTLRYCLGPLTDHNTYEAEAVGVALALELLSRERGIQTATILIDNQGVIQSLNHVKPKPAQHILSLIYDMANRLSDPTKRRRTKLRITWISGHDDVEGNEEADKEAKKAAMGDNSQASTLPAFISTDHLPRSISAACQHFKTEIQGSWRKRWTTSPRYARMAKIDDHLPSKSYLKCTENLTRAQTSLIMQLRTTHAPLNGHLHRIKRAPSPLCPACTRTAETVHHYLLDCRAHEHARTVLRRKLGSKAKSIKELLGNPKAMKATLTYIAATKRLLATFGDVTPPPDHTENSR